MKHALIYFLNEITEYDITNEDGLILKKSNSNNGQNTLHFNLDDHKFRTRESCRSELKYLNHMKIQCVGFLLG